MRRDITYRLRPEVSDTELNTLFETSWEGHRPRPFGPILERSLVYVCAYEGERLVGFVNLAWDGGLHAFLLDATVHPGLRRGGVGTRLVREAVEAARNSGVEWVHVDYEPPLRGFYASCGFRPTEAGLMRIAQAPRAVSS